MTVRPADLLTEVLLMVVTITAVLGFDRLFLDTTYRGPLIATAIVTHLVLIGVRRFGGGVIMAMAASILGLMLQVTWSLFGSTSRFGIPTLDTTAAAQAELEAAWELFNSIRAPAIPATGFLLAASLGVWAVAFLADWAAFRLRTAGEALLPAGATVIFISLIGVPDGRIRHVAYFMSASILFLLAHRAAARISSGTWLGNETRAAYGSLVAGGLVLSAIALFAGLMAGPALPGAEDEALIDWRQVGDDAPTSRIAISPLIDIRSRLVNQPNVEAFTVETGSPGYWRTMSLDTFNGVTWTLGADFSRADGRLKEEFEVDVGTTSFDQKFTLTGLDMDWLPAAYRPVRIDVLTGQSVTYEAALSTLIVEDGAEKSGMEYVISSERPIVSREILQGIEGNSLDPKFTALPADFDPDITALAEQLTADATDDLERALALQNWFRDPSEFSYSLTPQPGHDQGAIQNFLQTRVGYCEQFAGTFAAMARSIGLPTRIAVGFTDGEQDAVNPNLYRVSGKHAHSWPEVYIEGAGWLHFEPTPQRGAAETASYTGVDRQQVGELSDAEASDAQPLPNPTAVPGAPVAEPNAPTPIPEPQAPAQQQQTETAAAEELESDEPFFRFTRGWAYLLGAIAALAAYVVGVPAWKRSRRARERERAATDRDRIRVAWKHTAADLSGTGVSRERSETDFEFGARAAHAVGFTKIARMGELASAAAFSEDEPASDTADMAESLADEVKKYLEDRESPTERARRELDPRPLLTSSR